ncbi:hypothetical protein ACVW00_003331 [Marmoricola sp. URHA0025 HA25]
MSIDKMGKVLTVEFNDVVSTSSASGRDTLPSGLCLGAGDRSRTCDILIAR